MKKMLLMFFVVCGFVAQVNAMSQPTHGRNPKGIRKTLEPTEIQKTLQYFKFLNQQQELQDFQDFRNYNRKLNKLIVQRNGVYAAMKGSENVNPDAIPLYVDSDGIPITRDFAPAEARSYHLDICRLFSRLNKGVYDSVNEEIEAFQLPVFKHDHMQNIRLLKTPKNIDVIDQKFQQAYQDKMNRE